eukprot:CAMPEP_0201570090 /NCGR_PEP_ID=MMETSP0190_2-20130828/12180_1 /ASSEMBLY_ACC=CAM_ASM_000263 /TAXON_ID=37353 /ORGANISM="Rosalina sp." /LENGTH=810 /DNA_ID=CAMNT_0047993245 /DNA_START=21 /DNA_END=2450 /DNA_ORIENTATION=+
MSTEVSVNDASEEINIEDKDEPDKPEDIQETNETNNENDQPNDDNEMNDNENQNENITKKKKKKKKSNKTKSVSSFPPPPSLSKKSPYQWTSNEVSGWIESLGYSAEAKKFQTSMITGSTLFGLDRTKLQNDIKVFDVTARNGILKAIVELKKEYKFLHKTRVDLFLDGKTRKDKKKKDGGDDSKEEINDNLNNRKYLKIKKNHDSSDVSNWNIQNILKFYDFKDKQGKESLEGDDENYILKHCAMNNDKKKSVFMFEICNSESKQYIYLFTKNVDNWNIENVFEFIRNISNKQFILFADEMKRKKIDGKKLLKYNRQKLQNDYGNYFDSALRKKMLDELNVLKKQLINNNENASDKDRKAKTYHSKHTRTKSEIERDRLRKQRMRKAGPRDSGNRKIKYHGTKYDDSKDKAFLQDSIHNSAKTENFQKRKKKNPAPKKETVSEIGKVTDFKGIKYDDSNDAGFLADRINPLSRDSKFQKRKENNPLRKKETVSEIGTVDGYKGTKYDDSNDKGFLADRMNPLSKDERFQKRKEANPLKKKETVKEIGHVSGFKGTKYDDSNDKGFLEDSVHPLSKDERFLKRKEQNPVKHKEGVLEIGKADDFKGPDWKLEDVVSKDAFLSQDGYYRQRTEMITNKDGTVQQKLGPQDIGRVHGYKKPEWSEQVEQELQSSTFLQDKIKKEDKDYEELAKLGHKAGAVEVGKIKDFDAIDYELTEEDLHGNFLAERSWYDSSQVTEQFDEGISHILKSIPAHKLRVMDNVPLPTGYSTKIEWLKRLRDCVETELKDAKTRDNDDDNNNNNNDNDKDVDK